MMSRQMAEDYVKTLEDCYAVDEAEGGAPGDVGDAGAQDQEDSEGVPTLRGTDGAPGHSGEGEAAAVREADGREALGQEAARTRLTVERHQWPEDAVEEVLRLEHELDNQSECAAQDHDTYRRTEQGLQAQIADLICENGMLKNELRAKDNTIRILQDRRGL